MPILITGGSGFLGEKLIERLGNEDIRVVSRNEGQLVKLKQQFPHIEIMTGDIADEWVAKKAMKDANTGRRVFARLIAMKPVGAVLKFR